MKGTLVLHSHGTEGAKVATDSINLASVLEKVVNDTFITFKGISGKMVVIWTVTPQN